MRLLETKDAQFKGDIGGFLDFDTKSLTDDGEFEGYASIYGNVDDGGDIVLAGAFDQSLRERPAGKVKMLLHHDTRKGVGTWNEIHSDGRGLFVRGKLLLSTVDGRDTHEKLKATVLDGLSIGYRTIESEYDSSRSVRTIQRALLMEVSIVTFPMNQLAMITGVKGARSIKTIREFEDFLRDAGGFSNAQAKAIASRGYKSLEPRDEDGAEGDIAALHRLTQALRG